MYNFLATNKHRLERRSSEKQTSNLELVLQDLGFEMPQPSVSGMDPPFGDAFRSPAFAEQTLMSTDLLANSSDFMYELERELGYQQSPTENFLTLEDCKDLATLDSFTDILESNPPLCSNWEQWDTYCEDLTKYTKLASCDIWGTKEVDYLGLDDFSSPYQDEEVISKTPTLAQLNSEDSQSVADSLYYTDGFLCPKVTILPGKKITSGRATAPVCSSKTSHVDVPLAECLQKTAKPAASTQMVAKTNVSCEEKVNIHGECKDYVKKAKVKISSVLPNRPSATVITTDAAKENTCFCGAMAKKHERASGEPSLGRRSCAILPFKETQKLFCPQPNVTTIGVSEESVALGASVSDPSQKKEEHNYSLFVCEGVTESAVKTESPQHDDDEEDVELDEEDHDEGFGSEHELSDNDDDEEEEEEEEEEEDYEDDKDDISDAFSEPGYENDSVEDLKGVTAVSTRKRGKRRYFWEYSEQLMPSLQEGLLRPSEWNRDTLPSNMYQKNGLHHGKYTAKKSRRTDVEDLTPNPRKLLQIGGELRKLNKVISDLTPVSELPLTARPRSRKEKNKLASRACRLKKKAQYEANKVKLWGLNTEYDNLLFVINSIKQEIMTRIQIPWEEWSASMEQKLDMLIKDTLVSPVACKTSEFVNQVLEKTSEGDPTGGLVGLRIPTSKV
ncbi:CREB3 regulatory factor [Pelobates cultripes]|uniref:CREB3 regulatory factor n=1 Tax=Pelobates cultripes TaxID=61616 RepID=A0AAD1VXI3_PELCU|nr:CREB3 regulatory factor [Pelobates cultripes]